MKKYIYYEMAKRASRNFSYREKGHWKKRLKYLAMFAVIGALALGGLAIWGTVVVVNKVAGSLNQGMLKESVAKGQERLHAVASEPLTTKQCLDTVGGMLSPTKILTVPLAQHIESVRGACWDNTQKQPHIHKES